MKMVLQKFMVEAGCCSRRKATELIKAGKVNVNGRQAELGRRVEEGDDIRIGKEKIELKKKKIYIKLNKPVGYTCTSRKFKGEKNIFELLRGGERPVETRLIASLHVAGRLDKNSRGLVLLTNDGDMTEKLTHPSFQHIKIYEVEIVPEGFTAAANIAKANWETGKLESRLKKGVDIGDGDGIVKAKEVKYLGDNKFAVVLTEGKKRQIRRMFKALDLGVIDLKRVRIGSLEIGDSKEGQWEYLSPEEINLLRS